MPDEPGAGKSGVPLYAFGQHGYRFTNDRGRPGSRALYRLVVVSENIHVSGLGACEPRPLVLLGCASSPGVAAPLCSPPRIGSKEIALRMWHVTCSGWIISSTHVSAQQQDQHPSPGRAGRTRTGSARCCRFRSD